MIDQFKSYHVLVFEDDDVLLVRHGNNSSHLAGVYGIPGGRGRDGELEKDTAIRELKEETGLVVEASDLFEFAENVYTAYIKRRVGSPGDFTMKIFTTIFFKGKIEETAETKPEWIKISQLDKYNLLPNVKSAVLAARNI